MWLKFYAKIDQDPSTGKLPTPEASFYDSYQHISSILVKNLKVWVQKKNFLESAIIPANLV